MRNLVEGFMAGVNLGGWISQFREAKKEHFDSFITEKDIMQIASWGMDHVRLPVDYTVLEDDEMPFRYKEEGFAYIDRCIRWCEKQQLNVVLDLHKTVGYAFHTLGSNRLFEEKELQERFISLWRVFARRYLNCGNRVAFELLNEIVEPDSERWNKLSRRAVEAIREIDGKRIIIIGGNHYNSVHALKDLEWMDDDHLIYNFHFYDPHIFTHQKAGWETAMKELDFTVHYPTTARDYEQYRLKSEHFRGSYELFADMNKEYIRDRLKPALEFMKERKTGLYCGEYGVIETAPMECRLRWHEDMTDLLIEYGIGRAVWSYKLMGFPLVDGASQVIHRGLVDITSKK